MAGAACLAICDQDGAPILTRDYRGEVLPSRAFSKFHSLVQRSSALTQRPIFHVEGISYVQVRRGDLLFVAVAVRNANAVMLLTFLDRLAAVLKEYFQGLTQEVLNDNLSITYELLDEVMDNGLPQATEVHVLRDFIKTDYHQLDVAKMSAPSAVTSNISWRANNVKYKRNELFLDVVEKINMVVSPTGHVLRSEINGTFKMKSCLSGMPEVEVGLQDFVAKKAESGKKRGVEGVGFHQCVRLQRYESDGTISFVPPDGEFSLMTYRLTTPVKPIIVVETTVSTSAGEGRKTVDYSVVLRAQFGKAAKARNVVVTVPVPADADSPSLNCGTGTTQYVPAKESFTWSLELLTGGKELSMTAKFGLAAMASSARENYLKRPVSVEFEVPYFAVSGLVVKFLKVEEPSYRATPWVRYITMNGDYEFRIMEAAAPRG